MDASELCIYLRRNVGIRVEAETSAYLFRKFRDEAIANVPLMGGNARTGVAMRSFIAADALRERFQAGTTQNNSAGK